MNKSNIFTQIPRELKEELFEELIVKNNLKIQRIVSYGHTTQENQWYKQDDDEWVMLLRGRAIISFEDEDDIELSEGDYLNLPAYKKHRVSWTAPNKETIWLAVHY